MVGSLGEYAAVVHDEELEGGATPAAAHITSILANLTGVETFIW
jgi:hypothetical protein